MITSGIATVMVRDFDRALDFYTQTLGLGLKFRSAGEWAEVTAGETLTIGLHAWEEGHGPAPGTAGGISIGLGVQSINEVMETLKERGVTFRGPLQDNEYVKLAFFADPDGNSLYLCEIKPMPAHAPSAAGASGESAHG
jgi:catechol 2,3-dioxygenase-like lactoylglutathione lyase family enzyme